MHHRAGRAIKAVLEADVDEAVRNEAAFRLARIHFQKGQPERRSAGRWRRSTARFPEEIRDDVEFLRANVYMALGRPSDAVGVLQRLQDSEAPDGLLGVQPRRRAAAGRPSRRKPSSSSTGPDRLQSRDPAALAIVDKSNLVLGTLLFEASAFEPAGALARSGSPGGPVLEPGTAARGLGGRVRGEVRSRAGSRGASSPSAKPPTPPCRKRCSPCPTRTASSACTAARPFCTDRPWRPSARSCASSTLRSRASTTASS